MYILCVQFCARRVHNLCAADKLPCWRKRPYDSRVKYSMILWKVPIYRFVFLSLSLSDLPETLCRSASRCIRAPRYCDGNFWGPYGVTALLLINAWRREGSGYAVRVRYVVYDGTGHPKC